MANEAVFNEVLQITIDTSVFAQQMKEVERIYADSLKSMPNLADSGNNAAIAELSSSMAKLRLAFAELGQGVTEDIAILATQAAATESAEAATVAYTTAVKEGSAAERQRFAEIEKAEAELRKYIATVDQAYTAEERRNKAASGVVGEGSTLGPQTRDEAESDFRKNAGLQSAALKENEQRAKAATFAFEEFGRGVSSTITGMVQFAVAGAAIAAALSVVALPLKVLKDGFDYLGNLEERASQLKLALSTVETFDATNPTNNLKLMGQESDRLARKIEDLAITLNVKADVIQHAFEKFAEFGGRNLNGTNDQTVESAALLTGALQAQGPIQARATFTELQKLAAGTLTETNKLPAALGLSAEQLNKMSLGARDTHDFLEQLKAAVPGLEERITSSNERFLSLQGTAELLFKRFEGFVAGPTFEYLKDSLQQMLGFVRDNRAEIESFGRALGQLAVGNIKAFFDLFSGPIGALALTTLQAVGLGFIGVATAINLVTNALAEQARIATHPLEVFTQKGLDNQQKYIDKQKQVIANAAEATDALFGFGKKTAEVKEQPNEGDGLFHDKPSKSGLGDLNAEFREELDQTKEKYEEVTQAIERQVAARQLSHGEAATKIKANLKDEGVEIDDLIRKYKGLAAGAADANGDGNEGKLDRFNSTLNKVGIDTTRAANKQGTGLDDAALKEAVDAQNARDAAVRKVVEINAKTELSILKEYVKEGLKTKLDAAEAEIAEENRRHTAEVAAISTPVYSTTTVDYAKQQAALAEEEAKHLGTIRSLAENLSESRVASIKEQAALNESVLQQVVATDKLRIAEDSISESVTKRLSAGAKLAQDQIAVAQAAYNTAQAEYTRLTAVRATTIELEKQRLLVGAAKIALDQSKVNRIDGIGANDEIGAAERRRIARVQGVGGEEPSAGDDAKSILGENFAKNIQNASGFVEKFSTGLEAAVTALQGLGKAVTDAVSAYQRGGALGAAGSLLQNKDVDKGLGAISKTLFGPDSPVSKMVSQAAPLVGAAFTAVTALFSAGIQKMVTAIQDKITDINNKAALGQITLSEQITELQQEKQDAISQLGGSKKKGASAELDKILKSLNQEIAQLQKQQHEIITNFEQMVKAASLGTSVFSDWYKQWVAINAEAKKYVDAGGSAVIAAQYLNQQLAAQRLQLQDQLAQGDQTAIGDALQLNQLTQQRVQMLKDEAATEFGLINADSQERRTSNAVKVGIELQKQRQVFAQQISDLNNQISLEQQKVAVEGQIFDINKSVAQLQKDSNALTLASLNEQLAKYKDMQKILADTNGLVFTPKNIPTAAGATLPIPGEPTVNGPTVGTINITVQGSVTNANATTLAMEMARQIRSGASGF